MYKAVEFVNLISNQKESRRLASCLSTTLRLSISGLPGGRKNLLFHLGSCLNGSLERQISHQFNRHSISLRHP